MKLSEAKRYACRMVAREITAQALSADWAHNNWETREEFSEQDAERVHAALEVLALELDRRGGGDGNIDTTGGKQ